MLFFTRGVVAHDASVNSDRRNPWSSCWSGPWGTCAATWASLYVETIVNQFYMLIFRSGQHRGEKGYFNYPCPPPLFSSTEMKNDCVYVAHLAHPPLSCRLLRLDLNTFNRKSRADHRSKVLPTGTRKVGLGRTRRSLLSRCGCWSDPGLCWGEHVLTA